MYFFVVRMIIGHLRNTRRDVAWEGWPFSTKIKYPSTNFYFGIVIDIIVALSSIAITFEFQGQDIERTVFLLGGYAIFSIVHSKADVERICVLSDFLYRPTLKFTTEFKASIGVFYILLLLMIIISVWIGEIDVQGYLSEFMVD